MRPRKVILCVNDNEIELSVMSYMLDVNGYRVLAATSAHEAIEVFKHSHVELVLADYLLPKMDGCTLIAKLKQIDSHVPMILLGDPASMGGKIHLADALLAKKQITNAELLERIAIMSARKRGPRKGTPRAPRECEKEQEVVV